jgi:hypothetical protein
VSSPDLSSADATVSDLFNKGTGHAYGADVYLRDHWRGFDGWIGYAWGVTNRKIDGYNFGRTYNPAYDRRHQLVCIQDWQLGRRWRLNLSGRYGTGQPMTLRVADTPSGTSSGRVRRHPRGKERHQGCPTT